MSGKFPNMSKKIFEPFWNLSIVGDKCTRPRSLGNIMKMNTYHDGIKLPADPKKFEGF